MAGMAEPALRFLHYATLLGLFGWTAFRVVGLRNRNWLPSTRAPAALMAVAIAAPLLSAALMLVSIAAMMGVPVTALDRPIIEAMILGTGMGAAFLVRVALLAVAAGAIPLSSRAKAAMPVAALCLAGALATLGWSGHAAATEGGLGLIHRLNNGVHLMAAGLWLGAIGWFLVLTALAHRRPEAIPVQALLTEMHRFAPLGIGLVAAVSLTGLVNAELTFGLDNVAAVSGTSYGLMLAAKLVLVGGMLAFAAHHSRMARRCAQLADAQSGGRVQVLARLRISLAAELALGLGVTGAVALLGLMAPMAMSP